MAASNGRKTSSSNRKTTKSTGKKTSARKRKEEEARAARNRALYHEIGLIMLFAAMVFLFCCNFGIIGPVGDAVSGVLFGLFGLSAYVLPVLLFLAAAFWFANEGNPSAVRKLIAGTVLFVVFGIVCDLIAKGAAGMEAYDAGLLYENCRVAKYGGGVVGGSISFFLQGYLETIGTVLVVLLFAVVSLILLTEKSLLSSVKQGGRRMREISREEAARRREMAERRRMEQEEELEEEEPEENFVRGHGRKSRASQEEAGNRRRNQEEQRARKAEERRLRAEEKENEKILRTDRKKASITLDARFFKSEDAGRHRDDMHEIILSAEELGIEEQAAAEDGAAGVSVSGAKPVREAEPVIRIHKEEEKVNPVEAVPGAECLYDREAFAGPEPVGARGRAEEAERSEDGRTGMQDSGPGFGRVLREDFRGTTVERVQRQDFLGAEGGAVNPEEGHGAEFTDAGTEEGSEAGLEQREDFREDVGEHVREFREDAEERTQRGEVSEAGRSAAQREDIREDVRERVREFREDAEERMQREEVSEAGGSAAQREEFREAGEHVREARGAVSSGDTRPGASLPQKVQRETEVPKKYMFPPISLLQKGVAVTGESERELRETAIHLQQTLGTFGVKVTITDISQGPSVTRYELQPEQGVKVSKIVGLADDIKLNLAAMDIRIEAPIPGKAAIGIEVPNKETMPVALRDLFETREFQDFPSSITFAVGKDIAGKVVVSDIAKMPHMLIAGATGSGKSVCINTLIMSILYKAHPDDVKLIMVDPKVVELSIYNGIPHLLIPVVTDPKKASAALHWGVSEMEDRYRKFAEYNVRDLKGYNKKVEAQREKGDANAPKKLPQIVIIVDELADLMMVCPGEVEESICRLAQLARACGIHLIIATQRPSVDVITGLIKANMPSRVAFSVSSGVDSRTILDMVGAEKLLGKGDMLFYPQGYPKPARVQGAFVSDQEVSDVVDFLKNQTLGNVYAEDIEAEITNMGSSSGGSRASGGSDVDELFERAGRLIIDKDKASIGMLQRALQIGFNRAARIMDQLCQYGVVGEEEGTKPRKILMSPEQFEQLLEEVA